MREPRGLCDLARHKLAALRAAGCAVSDDDVVRLNALAWEIETPSKRDALARGRPTAVGNVVLWPLTCAAYHWWTDNCETFDDPLLAMAYAMANAREDLSQKSNADVRRFSRSIRARREQIEIAVETVLSEDGMDGGKTDDGSGHTVSELSLIMHALHGGTPQLWETQVSIGYIRDYISVLLQQSACGDGKARSVLRDKANYEFAKACKEIEGRANG